MLFIAQSFSIDAQTTCLVIRHVQHPAPSFLWRPYRSPETSSALRSLVETAGMNVLANTKDFTYDSDLNRNLRFRKMTYRSIYLIVLRYLLTLQSYDAYYLFVHKRKGQQKTFNMQKCSRNNHEYLAKMVVTSFLDVHVGIETFAH